jgi:hypothetical protein
MAMSSPIGEAEVRRRQAEVAQRERERREKSRAHLREQLGAGLRKTFSFVIAATVVLYLVLNGGHFKSVAQFGQRLSAKVSAHTAIKPGSLSDQKDLDEVTK